MNESQQQKYEEIIYLDCAAFAPTWPFVKKAAAIEPLANPHSLHPWGISSHKLIRDVEGTLKQFVGAGPGKFHWLSSGSEANRLAVHLGTRDGLPLLTTGCSHKSILEAPGKKLRVIVDGAGRVNELELEKLLKGGHIGLVSLILVNNETGIIQPIKKARELTTRYGVPLHLDCVQALGKVPLDFSKHCDMASFSSHKIGGPMGVGCLWVSSKCQYAVPYLGTPNVPGIIGFASVISKTNIGHHTETTTKLAVELLGHLVMILGKKAELMFDGVVPIHTEHRLASILPITFHGLDAVKLQMILADKGVFVGIGSACDGMNARGSHVLREIGFSESVIHSTIRISFDSRTTKTEIILAAARICSTVQELQGK